jgi:hypothetical protein
VNAFGERQLYVLMMQFVCSPGFMLLCLKYLQVYHHMNNFFLLNTIACLGPFIYSTSSLISFLPCPFMAALICNTGLFVFFLGTIFLGSIHGNIFMTFTFASMTFPWVMALTMLARILVGQKDRQLHPLKHIPFLALGGALSNYCWLKAAKGLSVRSIML